MKVLLCAKAFETMEFSVFIDVMRWARESFGNDVHTCGFREFGFKEEAFHPKTQNLIRAFHKEGKPIATVCVAAFALAESGILKGKRATVYHLDNGKTQQELAEYGVNVVNVPIMEILLHHTVQKRL